MAVLSRFSLPNIARTSTAGGAPPSPQASMESSSGSSSSYGDELQCWICLGGASEGQLVRPCRCPRHVHSSCLARWQLASAGREEEQRCRFCHSELSDWKLRLTPASVKGRLGAAQTIANVRINGVLYRIPMREGPEGKAHFEACIRKLSGLPPDSSMKLTFKTKDPLTKQDLVLSGSETYAAAAHCAAITAASMQVPGLLTLLRMAAQDWIHKRL